jgi:carboxylate-amine ligase
LDEVSDHAIDLGCRDELDGVQDLLERGNGAQRQVVVFEANRDMRELMAEIVEATDTSVA